MDLYKCDALSREKIKKIVSEFRKKLNIEKLLYIPVVELLDVLKKYDDRFSYEVVEEYEMEKDVHGEFDVDNYVIKIKQSIFDRAADGYGRDRFTIAHEIAHYVLICVYGIKFYLREENENVPAFISPEWQANCFAGELLMNSNLITNMEIDEIVEKCGVSKEAAEYQYSKNQRKKVNKNDCEN